MALWKVPLDLTSRRRHLRRQRISGDWALSAGRLARTEPDRKRLSPKREPKTPLKHPFLVDFISFLALFGLFSLIP